MSCKIAEELTIKAVLAPQAQAKGGNATGAYIACPPGLGSIDFVVRHGALAEGKSVTVEVYQATDTSGTGAAEITAYETASTAGTGGATDGIIIVSVDNCDVSKGFVTVKVSNDSAVDAVPVDAFAMIRKQYCK
jgi:hypothetical protein